MLRRLPSIAACFALTVLSVAPPAASAPADVAVTVDGVGSAHGMGLAMDGVQGQARAGWSYDKILSTFYSGATRGKASGTVRVGLAEADEHRVDLPSGGEVSDGGSGNGFPFRVPPGGGVAVRYAEGTYTVRPVGVVTAAQTEIVPVPSPGSTPGPPPQPAPPGATPSPSPSPGPGATPSASPTPGPGGSAVRTSTRSIWITTPGVSVLAATGRRYKGSMEIRFGEASRSLWAVNRVDLETYTRGIAEEKGQGWPVEGLKVLAVAARSLAYATMTWYGRNHANGFDICSTGQCQVYLGQDGEEPAMNQAVAATAGEIRQYAGRPILAMYHGNGGGRTDSYKLLYSDGVADPYPYLSSVAYAHANPSHWQQVFAARDVVTALGAAGYRVPGALESVEILSTGATPRVRKLRVHGTSGTVELSGDAFKSALGLRSLWFTVRVGGPAPAVTDPIVPEAAGIPALVAAPPPVVSVHAARAARDAPPPARRPAALALAVFALALAVAGALGRRGV